MRALALVVTIVMGPAPPQPSTIAVHWQVRPERSEPPDDALRLSVRELVAARDARPVAAISDQALERARVAVSHELPAGVREHHRALRRDLDEADAAYREGRFEPARAALVRVNDLLMQTPELPGAAASAREAQLLAAKLAWADRQPELAEIALAEALRIDPEAQLSVREAAPELVARYHAIQAKMLAGRELEWIVPQLSDRAGSTLFVEIDGVPGLRPVPPGPHFMVVRRDGHESVAAWRSVGQAWELPDAPERISAKPELTIPTIEAVCEALELDVLLLAERREQQIGLQAHRCGVGFGPRWVGRREALADGILVALDGSFTASSSSLADAWPDRIGATAPTPDPGSGADQAPGSGRPWHRRGWVWGTGAGVAVAVAGAVVAGVLLGGRKPRPGSLEIDANEFIGGR
ncbi:hypothetical protein DB30_01687 [Enhygromyxa salina]|uniref:Uncharacterized protein n=1 Tax=Enhygromyxa salina TaxID=215803 RepID=A0A0C2A466_9BACT|nr:hypothetical protein [Enhygromyxa salina]KIG18183.1 hypothetical protein DB30_01687 [Enhygromyxa salina]